MDEALEVIFGEGAVVGFLATLAAAYGVYAYLRQRHLELVLLEREASQVRRNRRLLAEQARRRRSARQVPARLEEDTRPLRQWQSLLAAGMVTDSDVHQRVGWADFAPRNVVETPELIFETSGPMDEVVAAWTAVGSTMPTTDHDHPGVPDDDDESDHYARTGRALRVGGGWRGPAGDQLAGERRPGTDQLGPRHLADLPDEWDRGDSRDQERVGTAVRDEHGRHSDPREY